mmetsp:Transcript_1386/g.4092  ORF Transcript_1386/g.4092 Transcript_1386/m.4092 type:complete len:255 (-) Transcript_1386:291-1055(-)
MLERVVLVLEMVELLARARRGHLEQSPQVKRQHCRLVRRPLRSLKQGRCLVDHRVWAVPPVLVDAPVRGESVHVANHEAQEVLHQVHAEHDAVHPVGEGEGRPAVGGGAAGDELMQCMPQVPSKSRTWLGVVLDQHQDAAVRVLWECLQHRPDGGPERCNQVARLLPHLVARHAPWIVFVVRFWNPPVPRVVHHEVIVPKDEQRVLPEALLCTLKRRVCRVRVHVEHQYFEPLEQWCAVRWNAACRRCIVELVL